MKLAPMRECSSMLSESQREYSSIQCAPQRECSSMQCTTIGNVPLYSVNIEEGMFIHAVDYPCHVHLRGNIHRYNVHLRVYVHLSI